jgi:hypothetical protein
MVRRHMDAFHRRTPSTLFHFPGGHRREVTPVPIPNTEVKLSTADGTAWETAWESRSLPGLFFAEKARRVCDGLFFCPEQPSAEPLLHRRLVPHVARQAAQNIERVETTGPGRHPPANHIPREYGRMRLSWRRDGTHLRRAESEDRRRAP